MSATVTINQASVSQVKALMHAKAAKKVEACCILVKNEMKTGLSEKDNLKGSHDSAESAGDYPFKETGRGAASVSHSVDPDTLIGMVGSNVLYMKFQQLGTRFMAARPWVTLAYEATRETISKILKGK